MKRRMPTRFIESKKMRPIKGKRKVRRMRRNVRRVRRSERRKRRKERKEKMRRMSSTGTREKIMDLLDSLLSSFFRLHMSVSLLQVLRVR